MKGWRPRRRELDVTCVLRAAARRVARSRHAASSALHGLAPQLCRARRGGRAAIHVDRLGAALGAFFLAVGISAHALDELNGRPLQTALGRRVLLALAVAGAGGALAIGVAGIFIVSPLLAPLVVPGPSWSWPTTSSWAVDASQRCPFALPGQRSRLSPATSSTRFTSVPKASWSRPRCYLLSVAQRRLSTPVRELRRHTATLTGEQLLNDGHVLAPPPRRLRIPLEGALSTLWLALVLLAAGLTVMPRLSLAQTGRWPPGRPRWLLGGAELPDRDRQHDQAEDQRSRPPRAAPARASPTR